MIINQQLIDDILNDKYGKCIKSEAINNYKYDLEFSIFLSYNCNYNCSYCFVKNKGNKEQILKYANKLNNLKYRLNKNNTTYIYDIKNLKDY